MKIYFSPTKRISVFLWIIFLFLNSAAIAQCPGITVFANASSNSFCNGQSTQLSTFAGVSGGGYTVFEIPFAPLADSNSTALTLGDDEISGVLPIGFNFIFFGHQYSQFYICSNGFITFSNNNTAVYIPQAIPNMTEPNNMICGDWVDLYPPAGGRIDYFTTGNAPHRKLIVDFNSIQHFSGGNPITMQYILYETSNNIELHNTAIPAMGAFQVQGIEDSLGVNGLAVPGRNYDATWAASGDAWRFSPGTPYYTYSWSPTTGLANPDSAVTIATPTVSTIYTVTATDTSGCTGTATVTVYVTNPVVSITVTPDSICAGGNAQLTSSVISSNTDNYVVSQIPFAPVSGSGTPVILSDDAVSATLPIGFQFNFYTHYYYNFNISSNGFITFDTNATIHNYQGCCSGQVLPNVANPNDLIAGAWEDLNPSTTGTIEYFTTGSFPNRKLIVNFINVPHSPQRDSVTFQIILYETSNEIEIHTTSMPGNPNGYWYGHTEGIENATGTIAVPVPGRNSNTTWTAYNDAWRFTPIENINYTWNPAATLSNDTIYNPIASPVTNTTYTLSTTDGSGCIGSATITVNVNASPTPPVITMIGSQLQSNYPTGNQWYMNDTLIVGATNQNYTPTQDGLYTVAYTGANGCSSTSLPYNETTLHINTINNNTTVSIYPNPSEGLFNMEIALNSSQDVLINIFNIIGESVYSKILTNISSGVYSIDLTNESKGIYFIEIITSSGKMMRKINVM